METGIALLHGRQIRKALYAKTEPFKRSLARAGHEWLQGIEDPQRADRRVRAIYKSKGYSDAWVEKRLLGISVQAKLTEERQKRGVPGEPEHALLH